jgi:hypothetical protein
MATSAVDICNSALYKIGAQRINSLSDDTKAAKICNDQYDRLRKEVLRAHPWNFAITWVELAATVNTPVSDDYENEFLLPSDVLRILETDIQDNVGWEVGNNVDGNKVIFCNSDSLKVKYIKDMTNTTRFAPDFEEALAFRLAADMAYSLVQSQAVQQSMFQYYQLALARAMSFDAQEKGQDEIEADVFTDIRG